SLPFAPMLRPPSSSTLFPYTTLFRSGRVEDALAARARIWRDQPQSPLVPRALLASASDLATAGELGEAAALLEKYAAGYQRQSADRKSTRLNSSHQIISYAVFCLKKT